MTHRHVTLLLSAFLVLGLGLGGCKKDGKDKKAESVTWPEKPADDTPVVVVFLSLDERGGELGAKVRFFNFADKAVKRVSMTLEYKDEAGKVLKDFPWAQMDAGNLIEAKGHKVSTVGAFMPKETKTVGARMRRVEFADGSTWEAKEQ